jgi:hypothetical protein
VQGNQVGFESSLQQHLDTEQRRAVLEAIGGSINPDSTLGEIIDAAEALGWSDKMGDLSLADLAEALLAPNGESVAGVAAEVSEDAGEDEADADEDDEDDEAADADDDAEADDDFELEAQEPTPSRRKAGKVAAAKEAKGAAAKKKLAAASAPSSKKAASKKAASKKAVEAEPVRASKKAIDAEPMRTGKKTSKKLASKPGKKAVEEVASKPGRKAAEEVASKPGRKAAEAPTPARGGRGAEKVASPAATSSKKSSKKAGRRKPAAVDVDDRMSLDEAGEFFLPVVEELGEATMQALEEQTGVSRRKLRFHVGQLVKHGYLERHGMGRGTYYTRR